jgi:hypothetical protein
MRSLKHMKSLVDETLSSEAYSVVPKNIAEVRHATYCSLFKILLCSLICNYSIKCFKANR